MSSHEQNSGDSDDDVDGEKTSDDTIEPELTFALPDSESGRIQPRDLRTH